MPVLIGTGLVSVEEAQVALRTTRALIDHRYPHTGPLAHRAWTLRRNTSFYDALYVALAADLGVPLVTVDHRLGGAPGLPCPVELV